jgi:hypothetical protein
MPFFNNCLCKGNLRSKSKKRQQAQEQEQAPAVAKTNP